MPGWQKALTERLSRERKHLSKCAASRNEREVATPIFHKEAFLGYDEGSPNNHFPCAKCQAGESYLATQAAFKSASQETIAMHCLFPCQQTISGLDLFLGNMHRSFCVGTWHLLV